MVGRVIAIAVLVGGACVACFTFFRDNPPARERKTPRPRAAARIEVEDSYWGLYFRLASGGSLFAGTVTSVDITKVRQGAADRPYAQGGTLRFRVQRTLAGPARAELEIPYYYEAEHAGRIGPNLADWGGGAVWTFAPQPGQRLLLLLCGPREAEDGISRFGTPVGHIWRAAHDDPLAEAFADSGRYLAAADDESQKGVFRRMCQSKVRSVRLFALDAAFCYVNPKSRGAYGDGYDPIRQSSLALDYLRFAAPRGDDEEKGNVSSAFSGWFRHDRSRDLSPALRAAFEQWYLAELGSLGKPLRCEQALDGLKGLLDQGGAAKLVSLFPRSGHAGLVKALERIARSGPHQREAQDAESSAYVNGVFCPWSSGRLTVAGKGQELLRRLAAK